MFAPQYPSEDYKPDQLDRIEAKLDALILLLTEEPEDEPQFDLEGNQVPQDRGEGQEL